jgi:N-acetylglucosaminyldiphosphoundecaprenol N-acetyl-beta-D-mannosaminyltransferase
MRNRIHTLNTIIDNLNMQETLQVINDTIDSGAQLHHVVINAAKMVAMQTDLKLRQSVNSCDLINADGQSVVWASRILGQPLKERVAGIDLMENLVELAYKKNYKIFFFGAKEEVVSRVVNNYKIKYSKDIIAGYRNGYFKKEDEVDIAKQISDSGADILFVAISSPTKENFLYDNKETLRGVNFIMGVGGSFDVVSGLVKRAPLWMQKIGMEWFYRFVQEPKRMWKRYLIGNIKFIWMVFKARLSN